MNKLSTQLLYLVLALLAAAPMGARAEQAARFGDYLVHYNALQTSFLSAKVAQNYGIKRSRNRAMLNIAVQQQSGAHGYKGVTATVTVSAANLTGQLKTIPMRKIADGSAIYYIGEFGIEDKEVLDFTVKITPASAKRAHTLRFREQFFTR